MSLGERYNSALGNLRGKLIFSLVMVAFKTEFAKADCRNLEFYEDGLKQNKLLVNHTIANLTVNGQRLCRAFCFQENNCVSYNIGPSSTSIGTELLCQLNNADERQHPRDLKNRPGFLYRQIHVNPCVSSPCAGSATCQAGFGPNKYRCICPTNFTGENCQKKIVNSWFKANSVKVCIGAKNDAYGVFNATFAGELKTIKLSHISGGVAWGGGKYYEGKWGDTFSDAFQIHITDVNRTRLAPPKSYDLSYSLPGQSPTGNTLIFPSFDPPLQVTAGQVFWAWYFEDLTDTSEDNNSGTTCVDVFLFYSTHFV